jgi:hypothetical protein
MFIPLFNLIYFQLKLMPMAFLLIFFQENKLQTVLQFFQNFLGDCLNRAGCVEYLPDIDARPRQR